MVRKEKLFDIFRRYNIGLAYLFGSQKDKGYEFLQEKDVVPDRNSDLDIGIYLKEMPVNMYEFYGNLYLELSDLFEPFDIDIVIINEVDYLMKFEIIKGYRIYSEDEAYADDFEEVIMKFAEDVYFKQKLYEKDFLERLKNGII